MLKYAKMAIFKSLFKIEKHVHNWKILLLHLIA